MTKEANKLERGRGTLWADARSVLWLQWYYKGMHCWRPILRWSEHDSESRIAKPLLCVPQIESLITVARAPKFNQLEPLTCGANPTYRVVHVSKSASSWT
jgi:hypothetical protein